MKLNGYQIVNEIFYSPPTSKNPDVDELSQDYHIKTNPDYEKKHKQLQNQESRKLVIIGAISHLLLALATRKLKFGKFLLHAILAIIGYPLAVMASAKSFEQKLQPTIDKLKNHFNQLPPNEKRRIKIDSLKKILAILQKELQAQITLLKDIKASLANKTEGYYTEKDLQDTINAIKENQITQKKIKEYLSRA